MLNKFLYHLASGHAWFSCGLIVLLLIALDLRGIFVSRQRWIFVGRILLLSALCVAGVTVTPLTLWLAIPLIISTLVYAFFGFANKVPNRRRASGIAAGVCVLLALALELPYHIIQPPQMQRPQRVYIVADSLAAGLGGEKVTWPTLLNEQTGIEVRDLSLAGANAHSALRWQLPKIEQDGDSDSPMLICIGGNDMLGLTSAEEFGQDLDKLLSAARGNPKHPREVLMLELPLIPGAWEFGAHLKTAGRKVRSIFDSQATTGWRNPGQIKCS